MVEQEKEARKPAPKIAYPSAEKESLGDLIKKVFPKQLRPTKRMGIYFGFIFLIVSAIALFQFPFGSFMTGNIDIIINVGYPWHFLEFSLKDPAKVPLLIGGLVLDLLLYAIVAYSADVVTGHILSPLLKSKEIHGRPKIFRDRKPGTVADKVTQKVQSKIGENTSKQSSPGKEQTNPQ